MAIRLLKAVLSATVFTVVLTITFALLLGWYLRSRNLVPPTGQFGISASLMAPYLIALFVLLFAAFFIFRSR